MTIYIYTPVNPPGSAQTIAPASTPRDRSSGITPTVSATSTASSTAPAPTRGSISRAALTPLPQHQRLGTDRRVLHRQSQPQHGFLDSGGTYTRIDFPGSAETLAQAINASGQIVGYYANCLGHAHGFLDSGGTYTTIDPPGSIYTIAHRPSTPRDRSSGFTKTVAATHGFLDSGGTITSIDPPGSIYTPLPTASTPRDRSSGLT